jgi:lysozyme
MKVSQNAVDVAKHYEQGPNGGWAKVPYKCPADKDTIGYGHVILPEDDFDYPMCEEKANEVLMADLNRFCGDVSMLLQVEPTQQQFDALVLLAFNTGVGKADGIGGDFADSTLLRYFNNSQFQLAGAEFGKWIYAGGRILRGLVSRRKTEAGLFLNGVVKFYN